MYVANIHAIFWGVLYILSAAVIRRNYFHEKLQKATPQKCVPQNFFATQ